MGYSNKMIRKKRQIREKGWSQQVEHMEVQMEWTGLGIRRS